MSGPTTPFVKFKQRSQRGFGFAAGGGGDEHAVISGKQRINGAGLNLREASEALKQRFSQGASPWNAATS